MKVIVEHDEKASSYLAQYTTHIEYLGLNYKIIEIEEKYLPWLSEIVRYIEPNFTIELSKDEEHIRESLLDKQDMLLVSIGAKCANEGIDAYYNITTHTLEKNNARRDIHRCQWINCYSNTHKIEATEYIRCIRYLRDTSIESHKPIIIYANIHVSDEMYRYRTLAYKVINSYLAELNGLLITKVIKADIYKYYTPSRKPYAFYLDNIIYREDSLNEVVIKTIPFLYTTQNHSKFKNMYKEHRQNDTLYDNDVFYQTINPDEEIYVSLNFENLKKPEEYQALGLEHIPLIGDYGMLYAKKSVFDELSGVLKQDVAPPYYMPILSQPLCNKNNINQNFSYSLVPENLKYKGRGVYIGIITVDDVDYTTGALRTKDGKSRIACIWHQIRTNEGTYYYQEQIDEALASADPGQIIKLPDGDSISTMILGIAGGISEAPQYRGVATESEFIVAKVHTAPESFQKIYAGMPSKNAVRMSEILIGALKLISFAREQGKPLALCIPFNTNIDPHDGSLILYQILGLIAQREALTIIVPAGEESDKMHHYGLEGNQTDSITINMTVRKENQNVLCIIYQKFTSVFETILYPPQGVGTVPINLKTIGITRLKGATIYSNGYKLNFFNGRIRILFRIESPQIGEWRIEITSDVARLSQINIWISQQELNEHITLNPSSPLITVGSLGNINNVMTVGGYNKENMVVVRSSGRGYSWDNRVKPLFITDAFNIIAPCKAGEWASVTGTMAAASIMVGAVATLYNKFVEEQLTPFPNTLVMNNIILSVVKQLEGIEYPNPSQGYGIFDIQELNTLLAHPFVL